MALYVWIIFIAISLASFAARIDSSCTASSYSFTTPGCPNSIPSAQDAREGVPFLPAEENNEKCFRVQSDSPVALFLSTYPYIDDPATDGYYEIRIEEGRASIIRQGVQMHSGQSPTGNLLSNVELCVSVTDDNTIHVQPKDANPQNYITSWQDTIGPIEVNYILVQKYNDPDGEDALFQFCDGALKLLSQNTLSAVDQTVDLTQRHVPTTDPANTIDGDFNDGIFNSDDCHEIKPSCTGDQNSLGMEDGTITDSQITASSEFGANYAATNGRLNQDSGADSAGSWSAATANDDQWIQVDLGTPTLVSGIITQGRDGTDQWVTMFTVEYSKDCITWKDVDDKAEFTGNTDQDTEVTNTFTTPVSATLIRIRPTAWEVHISMRFELLGCKGDFAWIKIDLKDCYDIKDVSILVGQESTDVVCPRKWSQYGRGCYIVLNKQLSWDAAQTDCQDRGGNLVTVRTQGLWTFLDAILDTIEPGIDPMDQRIWWLGLNDIENNDEFHWVAEGFEWHGDDGGDHFENWRRGQPGGRQQCVGERRDLATQGWSDISCATLAGHICQISLCANGYYLYGGKCYWEGTIDPDPEWQDAEDDCVANGGHLVTIDSAETQEFLNDWLSSGADFWIGTTDQTTEGQWVWIDDPTTTIFSETTGLPVGSAYEYVINALGRDVFINQI
ncbi:uncharacterized protein [Amphiura filiformis]|uniref:uncharacterized protein n=1 Tax=Amphiura filiformis TaxID=82378 RepID=UPI003B21BE39